MLGILHYTDSWIPLISLADIIVNGFRGLSEHNIAGKIRITTINRTIWVFKNSFVNGLHSLKHKRLESFFFCPKSQEGHCKITRAFIVFAKSPDSTAITSAPERNEIGYRSRWDKWKKDVKDLVAPSHSLNIVMVLTFPSAFLKFQREIGSQRRERRFPLVVNLEIDMQF